MREACWPDCGHSLPLVQSAGWLDVMVHVRVRGALLGWQASTKKGPVSHSRFDEPAIGKLLGTYSRKSGALICPPQSVGGTSVECLGNNFPDGVT